jgi:hypothetical protein
MKLFDRYSQNDFGDDYYVDLVCFGKRSLVSAYLLFTDYTNKWYHPAFTLTIRVGTWNALFSTELCIYGHTFCLGVLPDTRAILRRRPDPEELVVNFEGVHRPLT